MIDNQQTFSNMSSTNFDRHDNMSSETLEEVMNLIQYRPNNSRLGFNLTNKLYGLFDGYLYDDLLELANETEDEEFISRIEKVVNEVSNYPSGHTQV